MDIDNTLRKQNLLCSSYLSRNLAVIKSNLMFKCVALADEQGSILDIGPMFCKWCMNAWTPGHYSATLQPQKHPKRHMRSLMKRDVSSLNKFQQKLVNRIKNRSSSNHLVFNCHICHKNSLIPVKKEKNHLLDEDANNIECEKVKKKKRKKKDIFAGLNANILQSFKKPAESSRNKTFVPIRHLPKKPAKKITWKQQIRINLALTQASEPKKKPSLLATFLDSM